MKTSKGYEYQKDFWEHAGKIGYGEAIFSSSIIERHIVTKQWEAAIHTAEILGIDRSSTILELGCGDGAFTDSVLAPRFKHVDAYDASGSAIERAQSRTGYKNVSYYVKDLTDFDYEDGSYWDGAFLIGFLHHVKDFTPGIVARLSKVCPKMVVVEPNGDNLIRKALELLPSYRRAGENSFQRKQLINIFATNGYSTVVTRRIILVPSFLPEKLFPVLKKLEGIVEPSSFLNRLCSTYVMGFQRTPE
jgi:hypothetical protein